MNVSIGILMQMGEGGLTSIKKCYDDVELLEKCYIF